MRFILSRLLALSASGLLSFAVLANADVSPPSEAELTSGGHCYSYFDDQSYDSETALQPCKDNCTGAGSWQCVAPQLWETHGLYEVHNDSAGSLWTVGDCVCNYATKTVIPDLTALGYTLTKSAHSPDSYEAWQIRYSGNPKWLIDELGCPTTTDTANSILITFAHHKGKAGGDTNPNKVPFRDILLSFWQSKTGRSIHDLWIFKYDTVIEDSMTDAVPEAYKAMGVPLDETEEIAGSLIVSRTGTKKGEHKAYEILTRTVFAIGIQKMVEEYQEMSLKVIESFKIQWSYGLMDVTIQLSQP